MRNLNYFLCISLLLPASAFAWQWMDLWQTPDQQGSQLLQTGNAQAAAQVFKDINWRSISYYRSGNYQQAYKQFSSNKTSDGQYNAGNAAAFMGNYQDAIKAYANAIALNPNNTDAITNQEIVKKLLQRDKQQQKNQKQQQNQKQQSQQQSHQQNQQAQQQKQNDQQQKTQQQQNQQQQNQQQQAQQNTPNNTQKNTDQSQSANNNNQDQSSSQSNDQSNNSPQTANDTNKVLTKESATARKQQRQDENNKQLLRRLSDDPGGLLQQKFLRDYARRHGIDENSDQGAS